MTGPTNQLKTSRLDATMLRKKKRKNGCHKILRLHF